MGNNKHKTTVEKNEFKTHFNGCSFFFKYFEQKQIKKHTVQTNKQTNEMEKKAKMTKTNNPLLSSSSSS